MPTLPDGGSPRPPCCLSSFEAWLPWSARIRPAAMDATRRCVALSRVSSSSRASSTGDDGDAKRGFTPVVQLLGSRGSTIGLSGVHSLAAQTATPSTGLPAALHSISPAWKELSVKNLSPLGVLPILVLALACSEPSSAPPSSDAPVDPEPVDPEPVENESVKNEVIVLGMIHGEHRTSDRYGTDVVTGLIRAIAPDVVLVEIPPDRLPTALAEFKESGSIREPRVSRFPEYVDALFPLTREMDLEIEATAGWTRPMSDARQAALEAIRNDPARSEDWAAYEQANAQAEEAVAAGGASDDPRWIHTDAYDDAVEIGLSVYNQLFNEELGAGGWDNINAAHYGHIADALDQHTGEGKRFLITYGAGHKGWFLRHLRQRDDIILLEVGPFLDRLVSPSRPPVGRLAR